MKKFLMVVLVILVLFAVVFFGFVPEFLDDRMNRHIANERVLPTPDVQAIHQQLFVSDLHNDALLWGRDLRKRNAIGLTDIPRLQDGNMALQGFSVVTKTPFGLNIERNDDKSDMIFWGGMAQAWPVAALGSLLQRALMMAEKLETLSRHDPAVYFVKSRADLSEFIAQRQRNPKLVAGWLTLEGAQALEGDLDNLEKLYAAGYRMIAPTHFFDTAISGSAHGINKGGLTELGRKWVAEMEARFMIIDLAHASHATIDDVLAMARRPVIVSHTGVKGTCANNRNLSDEHIKAIASGGGIIGIGFWPTAVCGESVNDIARAIIYTAALVGAEHVALGSDFDGAVASPVDGSQLSHLTEALLNAGMSQADLARVMGENLKQFLLDQLPHG
ncbi:MAG: membrane dipeptidase [Pseudomonadales bacterium]|nr:membrane dipeptidase [Pseudomonadales bacterium]